MGRRRSIRIHGAAHELTHGGGGLPFFVQALCVSLWGDAAPVPPAQCSLQLHGAGGAVVYEVELGLAPGWEAGKQADSTLGLRTVACTTQT